MTSVETLSSPFSCAASVINQWRHAIKILNSGGRFIVGREDFDNKMDNSKLPKVAIGNVIGESEFDARALKITKTSEVILKNNVKSAL